MKKYILFGLALLAVTILFIIPTMKAHDRSIYLISPSGPNFYIKEYNVFSEEDVIFHEFNLTQLPQDVKDELSSIMRRTQMKKVKTQYLPFHSQIKYGYNDGQVTTINLRYDKEEKVSYISFVVGLNDDFYKLENNELYEFGIEFAKKNSPLLRGGH